MNRLEVEIPIELCHPDAIIPDYKHDDDAGMDVYSVEDVIIAPGTTQKIATGLKFAVPDGYELQIRPRSGLSLNTMLRVANSPGTLDSGYRDELFIIMTNISQHFLMHESIVKGSRIAQLVLAKVPKAVMKQVDDVSNYGTNRGGGLGSTGV